MRSLTTSEIETILFKNPKAKRIAVLNFLSTIGNNDTALGASMNLGSDAQVYQWNAQTVRAIKQGIELAK